ncbi:electron carrier/ protein disulfide oxidoreductase [Anaeramoeba flamelloides]|uniref:Electron carrier/ protein disulfide oxidoreductase n=1 Tax=Anaeramoeba flamelloides TaxID=1746091 RepID=A0ABQ8XVC0_9EUKA|nr:electron carrier/ protein disulfide oxidoreductase [Anaeramoeba flamelloides]
MTYLISSSPPESKEEGRFGTITLSKVQENLTSIFQDLKQLQTSFEITKKTKKVNSSLKKLTSKIKEFENQSKQVVNLHIQKREAKDFFLFKSKAKKGLGINKSTSDVLDPQNKKLIEKLKKKTSHHQTMILQMENKQYDEKKNERIEQIQTKLRNGVNENNRVRDYLQKKKIGNSVIEGQIKQIETLQKKNTLRSFVRKSKNEKVSELQTAIKRKEFDLKKLKHIFETKSTVANIEKLDSYRLQIELIKQEKSSLEKELKEKQESHRKKYSNNISEDSIGSVSESDNIIVEKYPPKKMVHSKSQLYSEDYRWKTDLTELSSSSTEENYKEIMLKSSSTQITIDNDETGTENESKIEFPSNNNNNNEEHEKNEKKGEEKKKEEEEIDIKDMPTLFTFPAGIEYFKEYLVKGMSQENLLFYLDVKKFKNTYRTNKNIYQTANNIYKKYIKNESIFQVNIDYESREMIEQLIIDKKISFEMFNHAQDIVYGHMDHNEFGPFKKSEIYQNLVEQLKTQTNFDYDVKTKKSILIVKTSQARILNTDFHFKGKARNAVILCEELMESIIFILNSHYSISTKTVELNVISQSLAFNRFVASSTELQKLDVSSLTHYQRVGCFINIYNTLLFHIAILYGLPLQINEKEFYQDYKYNIGGHFFSLQDIRNGILRNNKDQRNNPYFTSNDPRREFSLQKKSIDPKLHFCLNDFHSSPMVVQTVYQHKISKFIKHVTRVTLSKRVFLQKKKLFLPRLFQDYSTDFGNSKSNILQWIYKYLNMKKKKKKIHFNESTPLKFYKNPSNMVKFLLNKNSQMLQKFGSGN